VTDRYRTIFRRRYTDIDLPVPAIVGSNIIYTDQPGITLLVPVTVTLSFFAWTTN
jgi:hypothetical protein